MRSIVFLILGAVAVCSIIYALMTGQLPRKKMWARNRDGEMEWGPVYQTELPRWYWTGVISYAVSACLFFFIAFVPWTVVKSLENAVPKVFPWFLLLCCIALVYNVISALVTGKIKAGYPTMDSDSLNSYTYRSDNPIFYWIFVVGWGFLSIVAAVAWWFL